MLLIGASLPAVSVVDHVGQPRRAACLLALLVFLAAASAASTASARGSQAARSGVDRIVFIDYGSHAGANAKAAATDAATAFHLLGGHPSWPANSTINYSVDATGCSNDCSGAVAAVDAAFNTWEVSGLTFTRTSTGDANPCGGSNSVSWTPIDGAGGTLASTAVCIQRGKSKEILGFQTVFDSGDTWSDSGASGAFDIQATATHEEGHTVGLDHVHSPGDAKLTMYPFLTEGSTSPSTLGCGDRLGVNALYGTTLDCNSLPGD